MGADIRIEASSAERAANVVFTHCCNSQAGRGSSGVRFEGLTRCYQVFATVDVDGIDVDDMDVDGMKSVSF